MTGGADSFLTGLLIVPCSTVLRSASNHFGFERMILKRNTIKYKYNLSGWEDAKSFGCTNIVAVFGVA